MTVCPLCEEEHSLCSKYCRRCRGPRQFEGGSFNDLWYRDVLQENPGHCRWVLKNRDHYKVKNYESRAQFADWLASHSYTPKMSPSERAMEEKLKRLKRRL